MRKVLPLFWVPWPPTGAASTQLYPNEFWQIKKHEEVWEGSREGERAGIAALPAETPGEMNQSAELRGLDVREKMRMNPFH